MNYLHAVVELLLALAWPAVALYFLLTYREPLRDLILVVPKKLEQTSKFSFGSLVFEMQATLVNIGDPSLARELPRLSRAAYERLLTMQDDDDVITLITYHGENGGSGIVLAKEKKQKVALELERVGLIEATEPIKDFITFAKTLPQSSRPSGKGTWIPTNSLNEEQEGRLNAHNCKVTPRGRRLYEVMIGVVLSNLTGPSPEANGADHKKP
jgi:hypothetical protein